MIIILSILKPSQTTYAAVLPDPVLALARISFPSRAKGMAFSCSTEERREKKIFLLYQNFIGKQKKEITRFKFSETSWS